MGSHTWRAYKKRRQKENNWNDIPVKHQTYCPYAGKQKKKYKSEKAALKAIELFEPTSRNKKIPKRAYYCTGCAAWHITSKA